MNEIAMLEAVLGNPYGEAPEYVRVHSITQASFHAMRKGGMKHAAHLGIALNIQKKAINGNPAGLYISDTHTIYEFTDASAQMPVDFVRLHELAHGYERLTNPELTTQLNDVMGLLNRSRTGDMAHILEVGLALNSISEGVADFLAIEAINRSDSIPQTARDYAHVYAHYLADPGNASTHQETRSTMPEFNFVKVQASLYPMRELLEHVFEGTVQDTVRKAATLQSMRYIVGYGLVRAYLAYSKEPVGTRINSLIQNPPHSFKEMECIVRDCAIRHCDEVIALAGTK